MIDQEIREMIQSQDLNAPVLYDGGSIHHDEVCQVEITRVSGNRYDVFGLDEEGSPVTIDERLTVDEINECFSIEMP